MAWREEWPGEPRPGEDGEGPFRVALKPSARRASADVAALADDGDVVTFDSRAAAERALVEGPLRLQAPAPNDPAAVDAYLVRLREPGPAPDERGPPAAGWTFDARPRQVGRLAEAVFDAYERDPPPVVAYAARDLDVDPEAIRVDVDADPAAVEADDAVWVPDVAFAVRRAGRPAAPVLRRYVAEVKHGDASFERDQRAAMERLAARREDVAVVVARVDLEGLPRSYDVSIRAVRADPDRQ